MPNYTTAPISFFLIYLVWGGMAREHSSLNEIPNDTGNNIERSNQRDGKLFSLFSIVQFKNEGCRSNLQSTSTVSGGYRNGTCYTSTECSDKGGSANGGCAAGFGVCCVFILEESGSSISQNCTYIRNPSFPSAYGSTTQATYTIQKCACDVCQLRLDFETFVTNGPSGTTENLPVSVAGSTVGGGACQDSMVITGTAITASGGSAVPTICGQNSGQHIYLDMGTGCSNTVTITKSFLAAATGSRTWDIKATQITCGSNYAAEPGCLQYLTGTTGRFESFNYPDSNSGHLSNQDYGYCIRQEQGYCCIEYTICRDQCQNVINSKGVPANTCEGFSVGVQNANAIAMGFIDAMCTDDYVGISGVGATCISTISGGFTAGRICGYYLTTDNVSSPLTTTPALFSVCDCSQPFRVDWKSDELSDKEAAGTADNDANEQSRGFCFEYTQLPC